MSNEAIFTRAMKRMLCRFGWHWWMRWNGCGVCRSYNYCLYCGQQR